MNTNANVKELDRANKLVELYTSPRARTLKFFRAVADGTRYAGLPGWFDETDKPVWDRAPCVKYQAVESAVASNVDLLLGENRYPVITSRPDEDESEEEDGTGHEESECLDRFLLTLKDECELEPTFRELYDAAQKCGTCVVIAGARNGQLFAETEDAEWATPTYDAKRQLESIEICYPYIENERRQDGWYAVAKLYRRVLTKTTDTIYAPGICREDGLLPNWTTDGALSVAHNLGFVPAVWYKHRAPKRNTQGVDGRPVHATITEELAQIDIALSMRHEGALHCRPQIFEIGVEPGYNPTGKGSQTMVAHGTRNGGVVNPVTNPATGNYHTVSRPTGARRKGPNWTWQYFSSDVKVGSIDPPGDALKALDDHIRDLRTKLCEVLAWVPLDPDSVKFAATVSGKALEVLRERQLNRISNDRQTFGRQLMIETYCLLLRVIRALGESLVMPGLDKALPIIQAMTDKAGEWQAPRLTLKWPPYFLPSAEDTQKAVESATKARDAGLITLRTAVESLQRPYHIENIDLYLDALEEESEAKRARDREDSELDMASLHARMNGGPAKPGAGGADSEEDAQDGSGVVDGAAVPAQAPGLRKAKPKRR